MNEDLGEKAGEVLEFMMSKIDKNNEEFFNESIEILTLCLSEVIKAGYCKSHWNYGLEKASKLILEDLTSNETNDG